MTIYPEYNVPGNRYYDDRLPEDHVAVSVDNPYAVGSYDLSVTLYDMPTLRVVNEGFDGVSAVLNSDGYHTVTVLGTSITAKIVDDPDGVPVLSSSKPLMVFLW